MADQDPVFQIQRVYLKEASLEQPNSPGILLEQENPVVDIQLGVEASPVADGIYEVCVTATVQTKIKDKTVFLVEAKQAGIFEIRNLPQDQLSQIMGIACPQIVYPLFARQCGRPDPAWWFPTRAPVGNQLPGDVRAAAKGRRRRSCRQLATVIF